MTDTRRVPHPSRRTLLFGAVAVALSGGAGGVALFRRDRFGGEEMTPDAALAASRAGRILLVDIRRPDEWDATGIPEGAVALDLRRDDFAAAVLALAGGDPGRPVALICARGVRSDRAGAQLADAGLTRVVDVPEGMLGSSAGPGWLARGLPVIRP